MTENQPEHGTSLEMQNSTPRVLNVFIVDDHDMVRAGVAAQLNAYSDRSPDRKSVV